jgi:predicted permease
LFSLVNGVLLKPLPWKTADRLVRVHENRAGVSASDSESHTLTNVTYNAWADRPQTIDGVAGWREGELMLAGESGMERVQSASVTPTMFALLGESPLFGANFTDDDARAGNSVILSYGFWQERFGGARDVLGKSITLGGRSRTIIAVMPRGFEFPTHQARVWMPLEILPAYQPGNHARRVETFSALARLKPGATAEQAASEGAARLNAVPLADLEWMLPPIFGAKGPYKVTAVRMLDWVVRDVKPALWILLAAGALLFAAAIGTVVNLQLAQATARRREVAVRAAIGAGPARLARQLFVETTTMAAIGGVLGLGLTLVLLRVLPALLPSDFPRTQHVGVDARVLALAVALTLVVSLVIGLLPARMARRVTLTSVLAEDGSAPIGQSFRSPAARSRSLIITAQVAIATMLLVGAALLSTSFTRLLDADRGFTPGNLLTARIGFLGTGLPAGSRAAFYREVIERVAAIRGVAHVGLADRLPLASANWRTQVALDLSRSQMRAAEVDAIYRIVTEDYFGSMGIRLLSGHGFTAQDTGSSEPVVVVNETFARRYLPDDPLGVEIRPELEQYRPRTSRWRVVGVVADVRQGSLTEPVQPELYATTGQMTASFPGQFLTVRTGGDPAALATDLRAIVRAASRNAAIDQVMTMEGRLRTSLSRPRLYAVLIGGFSSFAVLIAVIGLFGGLSYGVTQRRREIGIRTALGATPHDIVGLVLKQGVVMTLTGLLVGFGVAASTGRYLSGFLFGVTPADPATYAIVGLALVLVAGVACAIPARRAAHVDAIEALRH